MACRRMATKVVGVVSSAGGLRLGAGGVASSPLGRIPAIFGKTLSSSVPARGICDKTERAQFMDKLSKDNKDVVGFIKLLMDDNHKEVLLEIRKLSDRQSKLARNVRIIGAIIGFGVVAVEVTSAQIKTKSAMVAENLASNSEEIVGDLVQALIHGINLSMLGPGKPFLWKDRWLMNRERLNSLDALHATMAEQVKIVTTDPEVSRRDPYMYLFAVLYDDLIRKMDKTPGRNVSDAELKAFMLKFKELQELRKKDTEEKKAAADGKESEDGKR